MLSTNSWPQAPRPHSHQRLSPRSLLCLPGTPARQLSAGGEQPHGRRCSVPRGWPRPPLRDLATHHRSDAASEAPPCRLGRLSGRTLWERRGNRAREETSLASGQSGARSLNVPGGGGLVWCLARGPKLRALTQPCAPPAWSFPARGYVRGRGRASWKPPGPPRRNRDPM